MKGLYDDAYAHDIDVVSIAEELENDWDGMLKVSQLGVFTFRGVLNVGMLLTTGECAWRSGSRRGRWWWPRRHGRS